VKAGPGGCSGQGPLIRALGRAVNSAVARFPWSWRLFPGPVRRFFDSVAADWDERVRSDSAEYLMPLQAALDWLTASPNPRLRHRDGRGGSRACRPLPGCRGCRDRRFCGDGRAGRRQGGGAEQPGAFPCGRHRELLGGRGIRPDRDAQHAAVLRQGGGPPPAWGLVVGASSYGARTAFFTPPGLLERGFERRGRSPPGPSAPTNPSTPPCSMVIQRVRGICTSTSS